jgi:hypothetical protein
MEPAVHASARACRCHIPQSSGRPAPFSRATRIEPGCKSPMQPTNTSVKTAPVNAAAASSTVPTWPIITLSAMPISIWLTWLSMIGSASASVGRSSRIHLDMTPIANNPV